ncbi:EamA family transporter RarD [Corynebacterium sp. CCM 8835]|uniref:EamA family transporter RarD n=1 Tax=Corynebacterium antarcticum TaxID=2800405 RepID=A0A9Q4GJW6_9CORY|nr:EamA family transporter RarD [Corynebacterium antarcticum]MCK7641778.1 EamA family transporter RarD [Corynebacterium antarcticum]MCK7660126.1 EamA family transporter RarD [Corynebacterium antarcticum]MCL0245007.1 EamA family transporter RarD [Corynebacterium antarcticum]MCX7491381.1 EamA family transporter RarD [Corynebacterium antarcticum]MCX7537400.1 EamA family transporter RarD [Corynebacterium antarcticum]
MIFGVLAYLLWGSFAAYFPLLKPASPLEILAHRIVWTALVMFLVLGVTRGIPVLRRADRRTWGTIAGAAVLIALNWLVYVIAVNTGHVSEAALGYFINPLVSVAMGMIFLKERLRPAQKVSVAIAVVAVLILTVVGGEPPLLGLTLAVTFGAYGLLKKRVGVPATASLAGETLVLLPLAVGYLVVLGVRGGGTFTGYGTGHTLMLMSTGIVTAVPLLLFGMAASRIPLATIGMLQYMTPSIQMLWAVLIVDETLSPVRWVGFCIIWVSVAIYLGDLVAQQRSRRRGAAAVEDVTPV